MLVIACSLGAFHAGKAMRGIGAKPPTAKRMTMQASALLKLTPESAAISVEPTKEPANADRDLVTAVLRSLKAAYVEPITRDKETAMARGAVRGMMDSLNDPDSRFLDPAERKLLDDAGAGRFHGIGAVIALKRDKSGDLDQTKVLVISPMPGGPAEKAGLRAGDAITHVDGKWIVTHDPFEEAQLKKLANSVRNGDLDILSYQKTYDAALKKLKEGISISDALDGITSKTSGDISLKIQRPGDDKPLDFKIRCRLTTVAPVTTQSLGEKAAYIRITQFNRYTQAQFSAAWSRAVAAQSKGLVLDLRNNAGGLISVANDITSILDGGGVVANVESADKVRQIIRKPRCKPAGVPIVVLVNEGTASVAELMAGTLKEHGAVLVGAKTFGDGLVQTPLLLKDGSAAVVTTGKMLTAGGIDFNGKGLVPDREVRQTEPKTDAQLEEAAKILQSKIGKA